MADQAGFAAACVSSYLTSLLTILGLPTPHKNQMLVAMPLWKLGKWNFSFGA
jgi:hypothetical protein